MSLLIFFILFSTPKGATERRKVLYLYWLSDIQDFHLAQLNLLEMENNKGKSNQTTDSAFLDWAAKRGIYINPKIDLFHNFTFEEVDEAATKTKKAKLIKYRGAIAKAEVDKGN
jgi:hypothetical protein